MKQQKRIVLLLIFQLFLSWLSLSKDLTFIDYENYRFNERATLDNVLEHAILLPLIMMGCSIVSGIFAICFNEKNIFDFVSKCAFFAVSGATISGLLYICFRAIMYGPQKEGMLHFLLFPIVGSIAFIVSAVLSSIIFFVKKKNN
ncbi:hypothetical protein ACHSBP_19205 [Pseudoalteromonas sp. XMcav1-K]|uniref:hypothetical protein n=1 Tax=Pseudoalteromonas sp. XMcav1-K TaxID=3374372 RepID=UPI0037579E8B